MIPERPEPSPTPTPGSRRIRGAERWRTTLRPVAALALAAAVTVCAAPLPASAVIGSSSSASASKPVVVQSMRTNRLLDSNATFQGLGKRTIADPNLQWQLTLVDQREIDGKTYYFYQVKNVRTQWCLDSHLIKRPGVYMHKCNGNEFQKWSLWEFSDCAKQTPSDCMGLVNLKTSQVVRDSKGKKVLEIENYRLRFIHMS